jgi:hypothetical protein
MSRIGDYLGTLRDRFQIGVGGIGAKTLRFRNGFQGDLSWNPTADRAIVLPDADGTIALTDKAFQRRRAEYFTDFIGGFGEFTSSVSGTGASNSLTAFSPPPGSVGWVQHNTGSTATGRAAVGNLNSVFRFGIYPFSFRGIFYIPVASTGAESFVYRIGFLDSSAAESADGVFLRISASNVAEFVCRNNNIETVQSLGFNLATASIWGVTININADGNSATLNLYDHINTSAMNAISLVETKTITTNIPIGSIRTTGVGSFLQKTLGTAARVANVDFLYVGTDLD